LTVSAWLWQVGTWLSEGCDLSRSTHFDAPVKSKLARSFMGENSMVSTTSQERFVGQGVEGGTLVECVTFTGAPKVDKVHVRIETRIISTGPMSCVVQKAASVEYRKNTWGVKELIERQTASETQESLEASLEYLVGLASEGFPEPEVPEPEEPSWVPYEPYVPLHAPERQQGGGQEEKDPPLPPPPQAEEAKEEVFFDAAEVPKRLFVPIYGNNCLITLILSLPMRFPKRTLCPKRPSHHPSATSRTPSIKR